MHLKTLSISSFRNISHQNFEFSPQLNLIFGANGSGKTSLLEAVNHIATGRSFRTRKNKSIINFQSDAFSLFSKTVSQSGSVIPVGIQKAKDGSTIIKKAGKKCLSSAELAIDLPIRLLNESLFDLVSGAPAVRRQFLDWLVFHVEHEFHKEWVAYEGALRQRNSLLKSDKISYRQLEPWDKTLALAGLGITEKRLRRFLELRDAFSALAGVQDTVSDITLEFETGFGRALTADAVKQLRELSQSEQQRVYLELFREGYEQDRAKGFTGKGPHRSEFRIKYQGVPVVDSLSRGQQKLFVCVLLLSKIKVLTEMTSKRCVLLIDDLLAELDDNLAQMVARWSMETKCQVFCTGIESARLQEIWHLALGLENSLESKWIPKMFHVEHGQFNPVEWSFS